MRTRYAFALSGRWRHVVSVASDCAVIADTCEAEMRSPHNVSTTALTFRVLTPWMYISASMATSACSLR